MNKLTNFLIVISSMFNIQLDKHRKLYNLLDGILMYSPKTKVVVYILIVFFQNLSKYL